MEHGTLDRYAAGCRCSRCVIAAAKSDAPQARRQGAGGRFESPLPPPSSFPRCRERCGRLVWHFDSGLCGQCDVRSQRHRQVAA